jgi:hypothetical protein
VPAGRIAARPRVDSVQSQAVQVAAKLGVATVALAKLEADLAAARDRLERCGFAVARGAFAVMTDEATDLADEIIAGDAALAQQ